MSKKQQNKQEPDTEPNAHFRDFLHLHNKVTTACGKAEVSFEFFDRSNFFPRRLKVVMGESSTIRGMFVARELCLRFLSQFEGRMIDELDVYEVGDSFCLLSYNFDPSAWDTYLSKKENLDHEIEASSPQGEKCLPGLVIENKVDEELYRQCVSLMIGERKVSHAMLQSRFRIDLFEADQMILLAKKRGVISEGGVIELEGGEV